jgi:hypothetical protein
MTEFCKYIKESVGLRLMPPALEIIDPDKRQEFHQDYKRLVGRCGRTTMNSLRSLYLLEQQIQEKEGVEILPKITILGTNNTAEIIARFVENGLADYYLSEKIVSPTVIAYNKDGKPFLIGSFHSDHTTYRVKKDGIPKLFAPEVNRFQAAKEKATLIAPEEIRKVFAQIDAQYLQG